MNPAIVVNFDEHYQPVIKHIRSSVFTLEQGVPENLDFEGKDPDATHALVRDGNRYIGTGRMLGDGHIGRVAVLGEYRQMGFGKSIIAALIDAANHLGLERVFLGAQLHAVDFYKKLGFSEYGEVFFDAGIEHIHMERKIR
jgi:predicted GNAT family N-acyltransferase